MPIFRKQSLHEQTVISNTVIHDKHLSYAARGIFLYLSHLPDTNAVSLAAIARRSPSDTPQNVSAALKELERHGYLSIRPPKCLPASEQSPDLAWLDLHNQPLPKGRAS